MSRNLYTYIVLVDGAAGELANRIGIQGEFNFLAGVVEPRSRNVVSRDIVLGQFVSSAHTKMAKAIFESVDLFVTFHRD